MTDSHELLLEAPAPNAARPATDKRHRLVVATFLIGVLAIVGVIVGTTSNHGGQTSQSGGPRAQAQTQEQVQSSDAAKFIAVHPLLQNMPRNAIAVPSDPSVERFEGSFHVETPSHHTHYDYVVETVKDRVHLEEVMAIDAVTCHGDRLTIAFNASTEATAFAATLNPGRTVITILAAWRGCGAKSIIKKVATNANIQISGTDVTVTTIEASITSLFKNADIRFNGTGFETGTAAGSAATAGTTGTRTRRDNQRKDIFSDLWNDITGAISSEWDTVVGDVTSAFSSVQNFMADAEKVADFIERLVQNKGDYSKSGDVWSKNVQVGPTPVSSSLPAVTSQYGYDLQLEYTLQITDYSLQSVSMTAAGAAHASVDAQGQVFSYSNQGSFGPYTVVPQETFIVFTIPAGPVPIPVSISGSMTTKLDWTFDGSVSVDANIRASGQVSAGFTWTDSAGFSPTDTYNFDSDAVMNYVTATATATGTITANTQLLIEAMYSVGLQTQVAVAPVVRATITETVEGGGISVDYGQSSGLVATPINPQSPPYNSPCHPQTTNDAVDTPSVLVSVGVGVTATAAAVIDIPDLHVDDSYHICNGPCFSRLWNPVDSWCIHPQV